MRIEEETVLCISFAVYYNGGLMEVVPRVLLLSPVYSVSSLLCLNSIARGAPFAGDSGAPVRGVSFYCAHCAQRRISCASSSMSSILRCLTLQECDLSGNLQIPACFSVGVGSAGGCLGQQRGHHYTPPPPHCKGSHILYTQATAMMLCIWWAVPTKTHSRE